MKKLIYLDDKAKKFVISIIVLAFAGVITMSMFLGCTGEEVDRAKDTTDRIIDIIDSVDEIEKEIKGTTGTASGVMMNNPLPQGGIVPPSSPNSTRGSHINGNISYVSHMHPDSDPYACPLDWVCDRLLHFVPPHDDSVCPRPVYWEWNQYDLHGLGQPMYDPAPAPQCLFEDACWNGCA